jgi:Fibronectin type III domain
LRRMPRSVVQVALAAAFAALMLVISLATAGAAETGPGGDHLVVSRMPTGSTAQAITIVRFNGAGTSDGANWSLPTTKSGSNNPITLQGDSNAVGALARSVDRRYVTLAGYTTAVGGNAEAADPRDVARIDSSGNVDTSTILGTSFEKEKIRGAVSNDGGQFWVTGNGNGTAPLGGMVYATKGSSSPTIVVSKEAPVSSSNKALNNFRSVQIAGGSLYTGSEKGTAGVYTLTGLPTKATSPTNIINLGTTEVDPISELPLEHVAGSGTVDLMYVARENEGIYKYSLSGSTWTERGKLASGSFAGIAGKVDSEGHFRIYAISGYGAGNSIVTLTDSAAFNAAPSASATTTVSTAASGTAYRGIAFAPEEEVSATVPGAPTEVSASAGNAKASLSWTAPSSNGGSAITGYKIIPFISGVAQSAITTPSAATTYTVEGLGNGTTYTFTVAAINANGTGNASSASNSVTPTAGAGTPTISLSDESLSGTIGDSGNPTVEVTVGQSGAEASALTVTATASSKTSVAAVGGVSVTGSGATRTVAVTPAGGVGFADITLKVSGLEGKSATTTLHYGASANIANPSTARWHTFAADASTAIDVGGGYALFGDDENNVIRLYKRDASGAPVKTWDFNSQMGSPEEIDIEASAQVGNTIYWTGSMGNSKKGNLKPDRSILFTTKISGSGAATELTFGGYYRGLRADLIKWDEEHGSRFGFAAGAASGNVPKQIDGFNAEGMEFAAGSSTSGYIGFRAPLSPASAGGKAIVVPVTNLANLATSGQNTSLHATFGEPLLWNLGGLSVRELRRNADGEYLVIAGSWAATGSQALYTWDGKPADQPVKALTSIGAAEGEGEDAGAWEGIVNITDPLTSGDDVELVMDDGAVNLYGDGVEAKEQIAEFQKSPTQHFTLLLPSKLKVAKAGTGSGTVTSSPAGISCGSTCESSFEPGTLVKLTGTPAAGSKAVVWSGCDSVNGSNQCEVTVSGTKEVTATFNLIPSFQLSVSKGGSGVGTVTSSPAGIDCGGTCSASYAEGTLVKLTGAPAPGSKAVAWGGCDSVNGSNECEVTMSAAKAVTATFALEPPAPPKCAATPIEGVGSSLQAPAHQAWNAGLEALCGATDPVTYEPLGTDAGLAAWDFNGPDGTPFDTGKAFVASDDAPSASQIASAKTAAGGTGVAVIPVAQTAIGVVVNPPAGCDVEELTNQQLESVFRGNVKFWGKLDTSLGSGCAGKPITRVVLPGASGTTAQLKGYLGQIDSASLACTEAPGKKWSDLVAGGANTTWPENGAGGCPAGTLSPVLRAPDNNGAELVQAVDATTGSVGYAAMPDVEAGRSGATHWVKLQNNGVVKLAKATFAEPLLSEAANCGDTRYTVPTAARVGAGGEDADWSQVSGANMKAGGESYPLCALTYDLALTRYGAAGFSSGQAATVAEYLGYATSAAGQLAVGSLPWLAPLPSSSVPANDVRGAAQLAATKAGF